MELRECLLTRNDCHKAGRHLVPRGVMVHSTGANNPNLRRYVGPDDGVLGENANGNHWNVPGLQVCVHAFIGKTRDGTVAAYQTLPWTMRGWHAGKGKKGSANDGYISFEVCEDDLTDRAYFQAVYGAAVELTAMLCREYGLDPLEPGVVICHAEGQRLGIASNHADVLHWWPRHGKTMDDFRSDVAQALGGGEEKMTKGQFKAMLEEYLEELGEQPASGWAGPAIDQGKVQGISDGTRPRSFATREEVVQMLLNRDGT